MAKGTAKPAKVEAVPTQSKAKSAAPAKTSPYIFETDFIDALYKPHTITAALFAVAAFFVYYRWILRDPPSTPEEMIRFGMAAAGWAFLVFGSIHLPDGYLTRPHPAIWRFFLATGVMYMCLMVFCLFVDGDTLRMILGYYDHKLRDPLPEQNYAEDCRISTPDDPYKFFNTIFDEFIIAHAMGYWAKALLIRDWRIVTVVSLGFEVIEVSLQHILPNFKECWWDHLLADALICNFGGTMLGLLTLKLIGAKKYHWVKVKDIPSVRGKAQRLLTQFAPREMDPFEWHVFSSFKRFTCVLLLVVTFFIQEVNAFTMKNVLRMPSNHHLVIIRLCIWGFLALPAIREYYEYIANPQCKRLGTSAWVGIIGLIAETAWISKIILAEGHFTQKMPANVALPLSISFVLFFSWIVMYYGLPFLRRWLITRLFMNIVFYSIPVILFAMCAMSNVDTMWKQEEFLDLVETYDLWW